MDEHQMREAQFKLLAKQFDTRPHPMCETCEHFKSPVGTVQKDNHIYMQYHCGEDGHEVTKRLIA